MKKDISILILYFIVTIIFGLGIHFILKKKMWKPTNYFTITIIGIIFLLIVYQLRILVLCFSTQLEGLGSNTVFKLIDSNDSPYDQVNLITPATYGQGMKSNDFANDNHNRSCKANDINELTVLVTASAQLLSDAKNTYNALSNVYDAIKTGSQTETQILNELKAQLNRLDSELKV